MLIDITEVVFYCDRDLPTLGTTYLQSAENLNNEHITQVFRYHKVSTLHKNMHIKSDQRFPSSLTCCCWLVLEVWANHVELS